MPSLKTSISHEPLDVPSAIAEASAPSCGAVASFVGTVRESASVPSNAEKNVTMLEYEAHPTLASERLDEVVHAAADISARFASRPMVSKRPVACAMSATTDFRPGLEGVVAVETEIAEPDREGGALRYRGVDIEELVGHYPYENVWGLLVDNDLSSTMPEPEPCRHRQTTEVHRFGDAGTVGCQAPLPV